jgi:hypothetical protein
MKGFWKHMKTAARTLAIAAGSFAVILTVYAWAKTVIFNPYNKDVRTGLLALTTIVMLLPVLFAIGTAITRKSIYMYFAFAINYILPYGIYVAGVPVSYPYFYIAIWLFLLSGILMSLSRIKDRTGQPQAE